VVEVRWTDQALQDIDAIAEFISRDSERFAQIQVQRFFDTEPMIQNQPLAGRMVPEVNSELIREIIQGNYRIIYRIISPHRIDVITVHHSSRLLSIENL